MNDTMTETRLKGLKALVGRRVRMTGMMMDDPSPILVGTEGTVAMCDDGGTLHVEWDNGRSLGLLASDPYVVLSDE